MQTKSKLLQTKGSPSGVDEPLMAKSSWAFCAVLSSFVGKILEGGFAV